MPEKTDYPFSKTMLVINTSIGILSLIFSIYMFSGIPEGNYLLSVYLISTLVMAVFSFLLKLFAAKKMLKMTTVAPIVQESRRGLIDRDFIILLILSALILLLPLIIQVSLGITAVLLFLAVYVTGFMISDPFLYLYCRKRMKD